MKNSIINMKVPSLSDALMTLAGTALCGIGVGIASYANLGLDAIGVLYDGIRVFLGLSGSQLGTAIYIVNAVIILFLWFAARRYVSIGTLINFLGYGVCTNAGARVCEMLIVNPPIWLRIIMTASGLSLLYVGIAVYIAVDTGVDSFTGVLLFINDKVEIEYKYIKMMFDVIVFVIGVILGGKFGVVTVIAAVAGGPMIQFFTVKIEVWYFKRKIKEIKNDM